MLHSLLGIISYIFDLCYNFIVGVEVPENVQTFFGTEESNRVFNGRILDRQPRIGHESLTVSKVFNKLMDEYPLTVEEKRHLAYAASEGDIPEFYLIVFDTFSNMLRVHYTIDDLFAVYKLNFESFLYVHRKGDGFLVTYPLLHTEETEIYRNPIDFSCLQGISYFEVMEMTFNKMNDNLYICSLPDDVKITDVKVADFPQKERYGTGGVNVFCMVLFCAVALATTVGNDYILSCIS